MPSPHVPMMPQCQSAFAMTEESVIAGAASRAASPDWAWMPSFEGWRPVSNSARAGTL